MLKVKNITKTFETKKALNDISFTLKTGGVTALLGENGAGKSTLMRILSGYFAPDCGSVHYNDIDAITNRCEYLQHIGYVQEVSSLYGDMRVFDFLFLIAKIRRIKTENILSKISEVTDLLELNSVLMQKIATLSKGFKKRTELAGIILAQADVMILDEPTEGLDPNQKDTMRKIIKNYAKNHIVLISTHTLEDVEKTATDVLLLHNGKLMAHSSLAKFREKSANLLTAFQQLTK